MEQDAAPAGWFASQHPGGSGAPPAWPLRAGREELADGGRKCLRKARPGAGLSSQGRRRRSPRWSAGRRARSSTARATPHERGVGCAFRRSAPSHACRACPICGQEREGQQDGPASRGRTTAYPAPQTIRAAKRWLILRATENPGLKARTIRSGMRAMRVRRQCCTSRKETHEKPTRFNLRQSCARNRRRRRHGAGADTVRSGHLRRGGRDGGRSGQRQEDRLDDHRHSGQRRPRPLHVPGRQARSGPIRRPHPRDRLRSRPPATVALAA